MKVLDSLQTKKAEEYAAGIGMGADRLMENAGSAAARIIREQFAVTGRKIVVVTGQGNNGGDGFVVARKLKEYGAKVSVVMAVGIAGTKNSAIMQQRAIQLQIPMLYYYDNVTLATELIDGADIIVDAIFGTGFHGAPERDIKQIIEHINRAKAKRVALDVPSGVICDNGEVLGAAVRADITVGFIGYKPCHFLAPSDGFCGKVFAVSIGFNLPSEFECYAEVVDVETAKAGLSHIPRNANKGTKGTALIFAGSYGMAGAAILSARAAMRSGVGIVRLSVPKPVYNIAGPVLPEVVFKPLDDKNGFFSKESFNADLFQGSNSVLIGPGLGNNQDTAEFTLEVLKNTKLPTVIDADGLNVLAGNTDRLKDILAPLIVTPHPGEMARLMDCDIETVEKDRIGFAKRFAAEHGVIIVLKGAYTVIAAPSGKVYLNVTGCEGMATAGSGDMLSGMIAAFLANGTKPLAATVSAVCLHGAAGEKTANRLGVRGMTVSDMIEKLPFILN